MYIYIYTKHAPLHPPVRVSKCNRIGLQAHVCVCASTCMHGRALWPRRFRVGLDFLPINELASYVVKGLRETAADLRRASCCEGPTSVARL